MYTCMCAGNNCLFTYHSPTPPSCSMGGAIAVRVAAKDAVVALIVIDVVEGERVIFRVGNALK